MNGRTNRGMRKRIIGVLIFALIGLALFLLPGTSAAEVNTEWFFTVQTDGTAEITDYLGESSGNTRIPEELDGYAVTAIAEDAFGRVNGPMRITVPSRISRIEDGAFPGKVTILAYNGSEALE